MKIYAVTLLAAVMCMQASGETSAADLTVTINRSDLEAVMAGQKSLRAQIDDGTATISGDRGVLDQLASTLVAFELGFEVMPGTKGPRPAADLNDFEVGTVEVRGE